MEITCEVMKVVGWSFHSETLPNSCYANLYEDGKDFVSCHSDDEPLFNSKEQHSRIISLSLGASRTFQILHKRSGKILTKKLTNGDLLIMDGMFQKYLQHRILKEERVREKRINLTWRWIVKHGQITCPLKERKNKFGNEKSSIDHIAKAKVDDELKALQRANRLFEKRMKDWSDFNELIGV